MSKGYYDYVRGRWVNRLDKDKALKLYNMGMNDVQIAKHLGISYEAVGN